MTAPPTKAVELPSWAATRLLALEKPPAPARAIGRHSAERSAPHRPHRKDHPHDDRRRKRAPGSADGDAPKGQDGVNDVLDDLFSYGTKTLDRLAFQKALDDIAANESAGFDFSLNVLKQDFSRGVQLLADNELDPALPDEAFKVIKPQTAQFLAGRMKSPGYRTGRALNTALLPPNDPALARSHACKRFPRSRLMT